MEGGVLVAEALFVCAECQEVLHGQRSDVFAKQNLQSAHESSVHTNLEVHLRVALLRWFANRLDRFLLVRLFGRLFTILLAIRSGARSACHLTVLRLTGVLLQPLIALPDRSCGRLGGSNRFGEVHSNGTAADLGVVHVLDRTGRILLLLELDERESLVLLRGVVQWHVDLD